MDGDDLPGPNHLQRHGREDLDDDHIHEVERHRGDGLAHEVHQQLRVLEDHQDLTHRQRGSGSGFKGGKDWQIVSGR